MRPAYFMPLRDEGASGRPDTKLSVRCTSCVQASERWLALRAAGTDEYRAGYLPYAIIDGWQQLVMDFAYWRADQDQ